MRHNSWSKLVGVCALALAFTLVALPAAADEMWVAPGDKADQEVGNWGTTNNGEARFSFSIPDDIASLDSARVVLLGKKTKGITWDADLSLSRDGAARDAYTASASGAASMTADVITEVDVSSLFPAVLDGGVDVAGLAFQGHNNGDLYVVGLRIAYSRTNPLAGVACGDDEVLTGYDGSGDPVCVSYGDILADVGCDAGEALTGFDSSGAAVCATAFELIGGIACGTDQALQAITVAGDPICVDIAVDDGGGGGGVGGGGGEGGGGGGGGGGGEGWSVDNVSVLEGNSGTTTMLFTVTLSPANAGIQSIDYATADGTATDGSDYTGVSGTLTFLPGQTTASVSVSVSGDSTIEPTETFELNLSNSSGPPIADGQGIGSIVTDDLGDGR